MESTNDTPVTKTPDEELARLLSELEAKLDPFASGFDDADEVSPTTHQQLKELEAEYRQLRRELRRLTGRALDPEFPTTDLQRVRRRFLQLERREQRLLFDAMLIDYGGEGD